MEANKHKLMVTQMDKKLTAFTSIANVITPIKGWIHSIRKALKMSEKQLAKRMGISQPALHLLESREKEKTISLKKMEEIGNALDLRFVYGFAPKTSLSQMIEEKARLAAKKIVFTTSLNMSLEEQKVSEQRIKESVDELTKELIRTMPRFLWDD